MSDLKYYLYISDSKVDMLVKQIEHERSIKIDFEAALKFIVASLKLKVSPKEPGDNIYTDLNRVLHHLESMNKIGAFKNIDDFNYQFIRLVDDFEFSKSLVSDDYPAPHCRFICYKDYGDLRRVIYLVGSSAYLLPRKEMQGEVLEVSHHMDYLMEDLGNAAWKAASGNLIELFYERDNSDFQGINMRLNTTFLVIHRGPLYKMADKEWIVTLGTPLYVARV